MIRIKAGRSCPPYLILFSNLKNIQMIVYKYFMGIVAILILMAVALLIIYSIYFFIKKLF